jgi:hypothetical protein
MLFIFLSLNRKIFLNIKNECVNHLVFSVCSFKLPTKYFRKVKFKTILLSLIKVILYLKDLFHEILLKNVFFRSEQGIMYKKLLLMFIQLFFKTNTLSNSVFCVFCEKHIFSKYE